jgi:hypothetical protein
MFLRSSVDILELVTKVEKWLQWEWRDLHVTCTRASLLYLLSIFSFPFHLTEFNIQELIASYLDTAEHAGMLLPTRPQTDFTKLQPHRGGGWLMSAPNPWRESMAY